MIKRYGGVKNAQTLDNIEEAIIYERPPIRLSRLDIIKALSFMTIKLVPITIVLMVIAWGLSFGVVSLLG